MSIEEERKPIFNQPDFRKPTIEEIFKRKKKRRRGYPRRLLKKWLKEKAGQNVMTQRGTIDFPRVSPVEKFRKAA